MFVTNWDNITAILSKAAVTNSLLMKMIVITFTKDYGNWLQVY